MVQMKGRYLERELSPGARSQVRVLLLHLLKSKSTREICVTVLSCEDILSLHARPRAANVPNNKSKAKNYQSVQTSQAERIAIWSKKWFGIITVVPTVKTQHARKHNTEQTTTFCTAKQDFTKTHLSKLTVILLLLYRHRICQVTEWPTCGCSNTPGQACTALLHKETGISRTYCATFAQFTRWEEWFRICHGQCFTKSIKFPLWQQVISLGERLACLDFYLISEIGPCSTSGYVTFHVHASYATSGVSTSRALNI